jgi:hypothetical protein
MDVQMEYRIRIPRSARLAIHHDNGYVLVTGVTADIEAAAHTGDIVLMLSHLENDSIDAEAKTGRVWADVAGASRHWLGSTLLRKKAAPARRLVVRMDRGDITIATTPALEISAAAK